MSRKKDLESLRELKKEKDELIESIKEVLLERQKKRDELRKKFNLKKE